MTREEALNMLYEAISPKELADWMNQECKVWLDDKDQFDENSGRNLLLRLAIELSEDPPMIEDDIVGEPFQPSDYLTPPE